MGFVLTSFFLSLFVEFGVQTSLTPRDAQWVGNWWLGFAIFGGVSVFWSLWLFAFPKEFPLTKRRREEAQRERCAIEDVGYTKSHSASVSRLIRPTFRLNLYKSEYRNFKVSMSRWLRANVHLFARQRPKGQNCDGY